MGTKATGEFELRDWSEEPYDGAEGGTTLSRVRVTNTYRGDLEGEGSLEELVASGDDGGASFVGLERVVGRLRGRTGSFVLEHRGRFEGGAAQGTFSVVPGSGTGELRGLRGEGGFVAQHGERAAITTWYAAGPTPQRIARWGLEFELPEETGGAGAAGQPAGGRSALQQA